MKIYLFILEGLELIRAFILDPSLAQITESPAAETTQIIVRKDMPRIYYRANKENGAGALPNRFNVGYGTHHGYYWEPDLTKDDRTLRQEIVRFVNRTYNVQVIKSNVTYLVPIIIL